MDRLCSALHENLLVRLSPRCVRTCVFNREIEPEGERRPHWGCISHHSSLACDPFRKLNINCQKKKEPSLDYHSCPLMSFRSKVISLFIAVITAIFLLFSSLLQASRNWLRKTRSSNHVNDSALFPDSWDGKGLEGGKFLSKSLSQALNTQGVRLLTLSQTLILQHRAALDDLQFTVHVSCFVCHLDRK